MNVSLKWAQSVSNVDITSIGTDEVVKKIGAQLGAVEDVIEWGKKYQGVVVVKVVSCVKHPNADKLSVCLVDDGNSIKDIERDQDGRIQVVCGAPNIATGQTVVWLPPGVIVPSTADDKEPFVLGARELRGLRSNGMIASPAELALSDDHDGILVITEDVPAGTPFVSLYNLDDDVVDCENKMFTHRPDCFGVLGVARELAGIQQKAFISPQWYSQDPTFNNITDLPLQVAVDTPLVPRFSAIVLKNVQVAASPLQMQSDLSRVGLRPINNIVDITNWLMHLTGQPLHAYDYDKLIAKSGTKKAVIRARLSKKGESIALLNGKDVMMQDDATVIICADDTPIGIGGVMGGSETEVDKTTKNIVLECANFDMYNIRRTAMKYGLFTDAVTRFNKGQSPLQNLRVLHKATEMVQSIAGGQLASSVVDYKDDTVVPLAPVSTTAEFINTRLGSQLSAQQIAQLLENVECKVDVHSDAITIHVPFWRRDIRLQEDIVEEVGRLYGYEKLPIALPTRIAKPAKKNTSIHFKETLRHTLAAMGANELLTYTFVHSDLIEASNQDISNAYKLSNALSPRLQYYRLSVLPSVLEKVHLNIKAGYGEFALFEIGKAHSKQYVAEDGLPIEHENLAFVFAADEKKRKNYEGEPYYYAKEYLNGVLQKLGIKATFTPFTDVPNQPANDMSQPFLATRSAVIATDDGETLGVVGELQAKTMKKLKLPSYCAGFELNIVPLLQHSLGTPKRYVQLPKYPSINQDITLQVDSSMLFATISTSLQKAIAQHIPEKSIYSLIAIDSYKTDSHINYTFRLSMSNHERTMTTQELTSLVEKATSEVAKAYNAKRI
ncbi:MAG TPA: phenylalanine--tRNA ligase subunit beta [Candidatus Saccharibacteria bacterium]|nr:phenylalanine--tRNA ligase subunit beta [Candidatus Saccharibacteria bacterium]MCB9817300.1 phenylalanine--tRNA ligase subunit beta [Candidatus Nomurabacteria bacterium]HPR10278.1 phenylalanine--tRNA ligase subunit beta [Candidatus Saccharibacteria bacterium]